MAVIIGRLIFVMFTAANKSALIVFAIFYGAFSGTFISLLPTMLTSMSRGPTEMGQGKWRVRRQVVGGGRSG
ncbi:hypothetical protein WOLCODRAFT_155233 [Wolfiporia cocos MD-104 SS10]|uniref:Uncharacterized protein n=1 Tax=Wolfiporia cocos (strain MD-104) TaxID=742152 RepID=A0A2H3IX75_WOLCO|nr:hypothetical protein WOLCODRAFT_155233 [Wolfiporia cocos MD-104 SS10]